MIMSDYIIKNFSVIEPEIWDFVNGGNITMPPHEVLGDYAHVIGIGLFLVPVEFCIN